MKLEKVELSFDDDRLETPLEEMSTPLVPPVEALRVSGVQVVHPARELPGGCFQEQMIVIADQTIGVKLESLLEGDRSEQVEKVQPVVIVPEDR